MLLKRFADREAVAVDEPEALQLHALITSIALVRQKSPILPEKSPICSEIGPHTTLHPNHLQKSPGILENGDQQSAY